MDEDDRGYSQALADPNRLVIVTAEYPVLRFNEMQGKLVEIALVAALDYVPRFVDCWTSRDALVCHCGGPHDGAWLRKAASKLEPWTGAKLTVLETSRLSKLGTGEVGSTKRDSQRLELEVNQFQRSKNEQW